MESTFTFAGVTFGEGTPLVVESHTADMGDIRTEDADAPYGDGTLVGRDRLGQGTWDWEIATDAADYEDEGLNALEEWERLAAAWRIAVREGVPGKTYPLTYTALGRTRRVYGRPGRLDSPVGDILAMQGQARGALQFRVTDPHTYDEELRTHQIGRIAPSTGTGLVFPAEIPFVIGESPGKRAGAIDVGGVAPTPFTAIFTGPVADPYLIGDDWELRLRGFIDAGQTVTVDTREKRVDPGLTNVRPTLRPGSSLGGRLPAGTTEVTYGGTDTSNSSFVTLAWRPAYYSV